MNRQVVQLQGADESVGIGQNPPDVRTPRTIRVLSVGSIDRGSMVHDALLEGAGFQLSIAMGIVGLRSILDHEEFQLAILHNTLAACELEDACRFIRRQWPHTRILVVRAGQDFLEDALYDDQLLPDVAREVLLATIELLTATRHGGRFGNERS